MTKFKFYARPNGSDKKAISSYDGYVNMDYPSGYTDDHMACDGGWMLVPKHIYSVLKYGIDTPISYDIGGYKVTIEGV